MKKVIIGHRGVGKSAFLKRHQTYLSQMGQTVPHFDLDQQIELFSHDTVQNIFQTKGEAYFRDLEAQVFKKLTEENKSYVISLGAGFNLSRIPGDCEVLLISRVTDKAGRIFLNRPRLNQEVSPLEEFQQRYLARHETYLDKATSLYTMPEGLEEENEIEQKIVAGQFFIEDAFYTLTEKELSNLSNLTNKYKTIELRTDLIPLSKINEIVTNNSNKNWLISVRKNEEISFFKNARYDFDIQIQNRPDFFQKDKKNILSCHTDDIDQALQEVKAIEGLHIKLSPAVETFADLKKGFEWQQVDQRNRSFLPRSKNGKWVWYRQLAKYFQEINFIRNFSFLKDQPSKFQWLSLPSDRPKQFGAVLGQPVLFSRSPEIHRKTFAKMKSFFTAIEIDEKELAENIHWLQSLGLTFAAVTSPLKKQAFQLSTVKSEKAVEFEAANTLFLKKDSILGFNTDVQGFADLIQQTILNADSKIAVWGGGGTLNMMKSVLANAIYFSSQTGQSRSGETLVGWQPDIVIWAAPRTEQTLWPSKDWNPKLVVDLNYVENSMGLEYAQKIQCKYESGLKMFKSQACEQQRVWDLALKK